MSTIQTEGGQQAVRVFFSYSHKDEKLRQQLDAHLAAMRRSGLIESWSDRKIMPGSGWRDEITEALESADVVLLLVSPNFIQSDFCFSVELGQALARYANGEALVIPIILRHCDWFGTPLAGLQALPTDSRPITDWSDRDKAFYDVTKGIRKAVEGLGQWRAKSAAQAPGGTPPPAPAPPPPAVASEREQLPAPPPRPAESNVSILESLFEHQHSASPAWMLRGLERARAVARIEKLNGKGYGTGFLISQEDFPLVPAGQPLLLTVEYLVSAEDPHPMALPPENAVAFFELLGVRRGLGQIVWSSTYKELDATIVTLTEPVDAPPCRVGPVKARGPESRVFLIGHPAGRGVEFILWDNHWLDSDERVLHYRAPTEPGSGGSPAFDEEWNLIALHHKRSAEMRRLGQEGTYEACEGVSIHAIRRAALSAAR